MKIKPTDITVEFVEKTGGTMTGNLTLSYAFPLFSLERYSNSGFGGEIRLNKGRGTSGSPTTVVNGDRCGELIWFGHDGSALKQVASISGAIDGTPSGTSMPGSLRFYTTLAGTNTLTERARIDNAGNVQMGGSNTVISSERIFRLRPYTVSTLPTVSPAGQVIYVSDASGGATMSFSDGTNWISVLTGNPV